MIFVASTSKSAFLFSKCPRPIGQKLDLQLSCQTQMPPIFKTTVLLWKAAVFALCACRRLADCFVAFLATMHGEVTGSVQESDILGGIPSWMASREPPHLANLEIEIEARKTHFSTSVHRKIEPWDQVKSGRTRKVTEALNENQLMEGKRLLQFVGGGDEFIPGSDATKVKADGDNVFSGKKHMKGWVQVGFGSIDRSLVNAPKKKRENTPKIPGGPFYTLISKSCDKHSDKLKRDNNFGHDDHLRDAYGNHRLRAKSEARSKAKSAARAAA